MPFASSSLATVTHAADILAAAGARTIPMPDVAYCMVVPFALNEEGRLVPGEAREASNVEVARRRAAVAAIATGHVGAVALSCTGDPDSGDLAGGVVLASFGQVDLAALQN